MHFPSAAWPGAVYLVPFQPAPPTAASQTGGTGYSSTHTQLGPIGTGTRRPCSPLAQFLVQTGGFGLFAQAAAAVHLSVCSGQKIPTPEKERDVKQHE